MHWLIVVTAILAACSRAKPDTAAAGAPEDSVQPKLPPLHTVREVLDSSALVGQRIRVAGRCLGYGSNLAEGTPPRTRSDWQLESDGAAIYVVGALPPRCSAMEGEGGEDTVTITAIVAEDTLPAPDGGPGRPRRYLMRIESTGLRVPPRLEE
jgi:hypothetical protein